MGIELLALLVAHQGQFTRTLLLEPAGEKIAVAVHVSVTGEERQRSLLMLGKKLESFLLERALDGVRLEVGTATVALAEVRIKLKREPPLELMLYGTIPAAAALSVTTAADAEPIDLVVLRGDRPVLRATRGASEGGLKAKMGPGDRIRWEMLVDPPRRH